MVSTPSSPITQVQRDDRGLLQNPRVPHDDRWILPFLQKNEFFEKRKEGENHMKKFSHSVFQGPSDLYIRSGQLKLDDKDFVQEHYIVLCTKKGIIKKK